MAANRSTANRRMDELRKDAGGPFPNQEEDMTGTPGSGVGQEELSLRLALRRLWSDHVIWTREYVVAAVAGAPVSERLTKVSEGLVEAVGTAIGGVITPLSDGDAAAVRLLKNQEDIGNSIVPFYGADAGKELTHLLKEHILIAVEMIAAARAGDDEKFKHEDARWTSNAEEIADLLSGANPNWSKADLVDLLGQHLALTKNEVVARLQERYDDDVEAFDQIYTEILTVSDVLSDGLVKQFPDRIGMTNGASGNALSLRLAMRRLWSDHVIWTREYIVAAVADRPDAEQAAGRLLKNQDDIGGAVSPFYGEDAGKALTALLKQHIMIAVDIIDAAKKSDDAQFEDSNEKWDRNAAELASFLSSANPNWPQPEVLDLLMQHLNLTRSEVEARLKKKHHDDVEAFDQIYTEILTVADVLSDGLINQFPERF
jgi:hypothetical protein